MRVKPLLILGLCILSSCATLLNTTDTSIALYSSRDSTELIIDNDSSIILPVEIKIPRSYYDLKLPIRYDSISDVITVKSKLAPEYWDNLALLYLCPVGFIIDAYSREKMYSYKKNILIVFEVNNQAVIKNWYEDKSGQFYLKGTFPEFSYPYFITENGKESFDRFMGIILGFDFYMKPRMFLSSDIGTTGLSDIPFPVMDIEYPDTFINVGTFFFRTNNNHDLNKLSIGYGINFSKYRYSKYSLDTINFTHNPYFKNEYWTVGCNFNITLRFFKHLIISANYIPTIYDFKKRSFDYSHNIYFDIGFRYQIGKKRQNQIPKIIYKPTF